MLTLTREKLVGSWRNKKRETEFVLREDGSAETGLGKRVRYPGTWHFVPPRQLLVRAVIPLNNPDLEDELNAEEMCYEIRTFRQDVFVAEQFDVEGIHQVFVRI